MQISTAVKRTNSIFVCLPVRDMCRVKKQWQTVLFCVFRTAFFFRFYFSLCVGSGTVFCFVKFMRNSFEMCDVLLFADIASLGCSFNEKFHVWKCIEMKSAC